MSFNRASIMEFWRNVEVGEPPEEGYSPCWNFKGSNAYLGYRAFRSLLAHRVAAVVYTGDVYRTVKQNCKNKCCVRLEHLSFIGKEDRDWDRVKQVLDARPQCGSKYTVQKLYGDTKINPIFIRAVLREAPLYDIRDEYQYLMQCGRVPQNQPTGVPNASLLQPTA